MVAEATQNGDECHDARYHGCGEYDDDEWDKVLDDGRLLV